METPHVVTYHGGGHRLRFPDRHLLFQLVHEGRDQCERRCPMPRCHRDVNRRLAHRHHADAMDHERCVARVLFSQRFQNLPDHHDRHRIVGLVFQRGDGLTVLGGAHAAGEFCHRTRQAALRLDRFRVAPDDFAREFDRDVHAVNLPTRVESAPLPRPRKKARRGQCIPNSLPAARCGGELRAREISPAARPRAGRYSWLFARAVPRTRNGSHL